MENALWFTCTGTDNTSKCEVDKLKVSVTIPATVVSFISHLIVVADDIWGLKNILTVLRGFFIQCKTSSVAPDPENIPEPAKNPTNADTNLFAVCVLE